MSAGHLLHDGILVLVAAFDHVISVLLNEKIHLDVDIGIGILISSTIRYRRS